jgi:hypothetical protein
VLVDQNVLSVCVHATSPLRSIPVFGLFAVPTCHIIDHKWHSANMLVGLLLAQNFPAEHSRARPCVQNVIMRAQAAWELLWASTLARFAAFLASGRRLSCAC